MSKSYTNNSTILSGQNIESGLPQNQQEVQQNLTIDGSEEPFEINGPVFAEEISIINGGKIEGPIYAETNLFLQEIVDPLIVQSGININNLIVESPKDRNKNNSLGYSLKNMDCLIKGDIDADEKVELNNTIVLGSIKADKIELNHSIVLGALKDAQEILVNNSIIGIYITNKISFKGNNGLFIAGGKSQEKPEILPNRRGQKNLNLRYLPLCRLHNYGCGMGEDLSSSIDRTKTGLTCSLWQQNRCPIAENVSIYKKDFAQIEIEGIKNWYLGLQNRSLSLDRLETGNTIFQRVLKGLFAYDHLTEDDQKYEESLWEELSESEQKIFELATN